jgi:predicted TPR repeat methyltransferase
MFGSKKQKAATAEAAPVSVNDDDHAALDPAWLAEQERAAATAERLAEQSIGDDDFAQAVWLVQADEAFSDPIGGSASRRVARIVSLGGASGLTGGQLAALAALMERVDTVREVLGTAERHRAVPRARASYAAKF